MLEIGSRTNKIQNFFPLPRTPRVLVIQRKQSHESCLPTAPDGSGTKPETTTTKTNNKRGKGFRLGKKKVCPSFRSTCQPILSMYCSIWNREVKQGKRHWSLLMNVLKKLLTQHNLDRIEAFFRNSIKLPLRSLAGYSLSRERKRERLSKRSVVARKHHFDRIVVVVFSQRGISILPP